MEYVHMVLKHVCAHVWHVYGQTDAYLHRETEYLARPSA